MIREHKLRKRVAFPLGYPAHYWHHTVLLLTLVHIEQNVKSTFHVSYSFLILAAKLLFLLASIAMQNIAVC